MRLVLKTISGLYPPGSTIKTLLHLALGEWNHKPLDIFTCSKLNFTRKISLLGKKVMELLTYEKVYKDLVTYIFTKLQEN